MSTDATPLEPAQVSASAVTAMTHGEIDIQIQTAKRYPRSVKQFMADALDMATLDEETAAACFYALPRDGKTIEGPSARLAEIVASAWGHMRVEGRVIDEDDRFVRARGTAWDLQRNVAIAFETRRRITDRHGRRYKDDMIGVTANAAASIAIRNAIFKVVPAAYTRQIYAQCREVAVGQAETLVARRDRALLFFQKLGVTVDRVCAVLQIAGVEDITLSHLATLQGLRTAIKEGDTSVDQAFPVPPVGTPQRKPPGVATTPADVGVSASATTETDTTGPALITERDRRLVFAEARKHGRDTPAVKAYLADVHHIASTKLIPVEALPKVLAWATSRDPGEDDA